jgi:hypothetical protein
MESKTMKTVLTVVERGPGKSFWTRVGVGFVNQDGSITLRLDAIPVNGMLQVRDWEPYERRTNETPTLPTGEPPRVRRRDVPAAAPRDGRDASDAPPRGPYTGDALA